MNYFLNYYKGVVDANIKKNAASAVKQSEYILNSTARYHGNYVYSLYIPKIFTTDDVAVFKNIVRTTYTILNKVIAEYERNPAYRKLFGFDKRLEELILRNDSYNCKLPIARFDIFYDENDTDFKFCEFNADGTSAMNEDRELNKAIKLTNAYKIFSSHFPTKTYELFDSWVDEFTAIYKTCPAYKKHATVAIVDFIGDYENTEFSVFRERFFNHGYNCEICDIRDLKYEGGKLLTDGRKVIDVIYRRAVTCDIMEHYDEVLPFISAVKNNDVCLIGDFKTQIIHDKILFKIIRDDMTKSILTDEEYYFVCMHFPYTVSLTENSAKELNVLNDKDHWIIKPEDSYASRGIYAGCEFDSREKWTKAVKSNFNNHYLLQQFIKPYELDNIDLTHNKHAGYGKYANITGLFVYNGKFSGIYSRISKTDIISTQYSEMALPTVIVEEKKNNKYPASSIT